MRGEGGNDNEGGGGGGGGAGDYGVDPNMDPELAMVSSSFYLSHFSKN